CSTPPWANTWPTSSGNSAKSSSPTPGPTSPITFSASPVNPALMTRENRMDELDSTAETIRRYMEQVDGARDLAYKRSRSLIALCARTIRAIHREEWDAAEGLLAEARAATDDLV